MSDSKHSGAGASPRYRKSEEFVEWSPPPEPKVKEEQYDDVLPSDSISQQGSGSARSSLLSSKSSHSRRARAITKEIELAAKAAVMKRHHEIERKKMALQRQKDEEEYATRQRQRDLENQGKELELCAQEIAIEGDLEATRAIQRVLEPFDLQESQASSEVADMVSRYILDKAKELTKSCETDPHGCKSDGYPSDMSPRACNYDTYSTDYVKVQSSQQENKEHQFQARQQLGNVYQSELHHKPVQFYQPTRTQVVHSSSGAKSDVSYSDILPGREYDPQLVHTAGQSVELKSQLATCNNSFPSGRQVFTNEHQRCMRTTPGNLSLPEDGHTNEHQRCIRTTPGNLLLPEDGHTNEHQRCIRTTPGNLLLPEDGHINEHQGCIRSTPSYMTSPENRPPSSYQQRVHVKSHDSQTESQGLLDVVKHQGRLTEMLLEAQIKSTLPQRDIPIFNGDALKYNSWVAAFTQGIEEKTSNDRERLYFMQQYTTGKPKEYVISCQQLEDPAEGFKRAKSLLKEKYGNKYKIQDAIMNRLYRWPEIRANDAAAMENYSLFLNEARNAISDPDHDLSHASNMKIMVSKLPYKMKERWRSTATNIEEQENRAANFNDFLNLIDRQSRIDSHPLYGCEREQRPASRLQQNTAKKDNRKASFATSVSDQKPEVSAKWCAYCDKDTHTLDVCRNLQKKTYQERIEELKKLRVCFGCMKKASHMVKDCRKRLQCVICNRKHATILHREKTQERSAGDEKKSAVDEVKSKGDKQKPTVDNTTFCGLTGAGAGCTQVIPVLVRSKESGMMIKANAMLDECSDGVFLTEKLQKSLKVKGTKTKLSVHTITGASDIESQVLNGLQVVNLNSQDIVIDLPKAYTCPSIPASTSHVITNDDLKQWPYLMDVDLPQITGDIDIIIGNNVPRALEPWEIIHSDANGPFATRTLLGWVIHGIPTMDSSSEVGVYRVKFDEEMSQQLKDLYNMDFGERIIEDTLQQSIEDRQFIAKVEDSLTKEGEHYVIGLPFKDPDVIFPSNRPLAEQRLATLKRKMVKNPEFKHSYTAYMTDTLRKGYAEPVPETEVDRHDGKRWYLPHHGVYHPQKRKLRVVFDCAATYNGSTLNRELLKGPDMTNSLLGVLIRFRQEQVALMADIEGMFSQVRVPREDRDYLRFLWWQDGDINSTPQEYRMKVHLFGATSSPACSNYALLRTVEDNQEQYSEPACHAVRRSFYVDDCLQSVSTVDEAVSMSKELINLCLQGGFRLTKWVSNNRKVLEAIPKEEQATDVKELNLKSDSLPVERALGMQWQVEEDTWGFKIIIKDRPATRRGILSIVSSVYDPLGLVAPAVLPAKRILQDLCKLNLGWDEKIPEENEKQWKQWLCSIPDIAKFTIPRCFLPSSFGKPTGVQLHHFSDASMEGYGTVSYLRFKNEDQDIHCSLVLGKSKVAPLKQVSIPRLELTAATTSVRINHIIQKELDLSVDETFFWTDSMTVLHYIHNETARYKTFVANRLAIIRDGSSPSQWRHVESQLNPADYSSRGQTIQKFLQNEMWVKGPNFLWEKETTWPVTKLQNKSLSDDPEVKTVICNTTKVNQEKPNALNSNDPVKPVGDKNQSTDEDSRQVLKESEVPEPEDTISKLFEHFSDWTKLKRAVAWWLRLKQVLLNKSKSETNDKGKKALTAEDLQNAEYAIIKWVQMQSFPQEFKMLKALKSTKSDMTERHTKVMKKSIIANLDPEIHEDGLLRVGGRLRNAPIPISAKHQLILPKYHHVCKLIIRHVHQMVNHQGRSHILAELRQRYWIVRANAEIKTLVKHCVICRKHQATVCQQKMADLPASRLQPQEPAFTRTGVDYFGPLIIKTGRTAKKRYGVLFTCLSSRAVHIEVAQSLDTSSFINAYRRFMARRGPVKELISDNGSNFVGANIELKNAFKELDQEQIQKYASDHDFRWSFNPPAASHFGGVWERQIRTVRKILHAILQSQYLKTCQQEEQLHTFLCEVEYTINSRPLTHVSGDPTDLDVLTPNDLLLLRPNSVITPGEFIQTDLYARKRWKQMQYCADIFWKRWLREYIPDLQQRHKWLHPQRNVAIGDIALVVDDNAPRNTWMMGRVLQVYPDNKGHVRQVLVKTKSSTFKRPVDKLCLLLEADLPGCSSTASMSGQQRQQIECETVTAKDTQSVKTTSSGRSIKPRQRLDL